MDGYTPVLQLVISGKHYMRYATLHRDVFRGLPSIHPFYLARLT
jgi:hypothetical protein